MNVRDILRQNLDRIDARISAACTRAGRARSEVTLVAVTKSVSAEVAALLPDLGVLDLAENRPQALWAKAAALPESVRWHMIGHLQRNKVERTLPLVQMIHSVDSIRLLTEVDRQAAKLGRPVDVLLEMNASREAAKTGLPLEELEAIGVHVSQLTTARVVGLMAMAALSDDPEAARPTFAAVRSLRDRLRLKLGPVYPLPHLSMGMSGDFEVAVEEGATLVRIGTSIFEGLAP